ncbi:MAG: hypothetical protein OQK46_06620 [Gammaproteobacteria bacterium]|nr:hypothetical protein [Gammaproteobacteria bacterium]
MNKKNKVAILGYGEMGHALEHLLRVDHDISIWDKFPLAGFESTVLEDIIPQADFILFCLPVNPHREIVMQIKPLLKHESTCLSIAKGLDEQGQTAAQIFESCLQNTHRYGLLYGPMISEEIRAGRYAFAQFGCQYRDSFEMANQLFRNTQLHIEYTSDISGISWSVILKNVYAILFGVSDELKLGDNMRGFLTVEALRELDKIVRNMGGEAGSPYHLAGLGDLITTATSESSHHHSLGRQLARGDRSHVTGEGVHTLEMVAQHKLFKKENYPLFSLVHDIVEKPVDIEAELINYINNQ